MDSVPAVLVIDDGELDDFLETLQELEVPFRLLRGEVLGEPVEPPSQLLITTGPRAFNLSWSAPAKRSRDHPQRLAVCQEISRSVSERLRRLGYHFVVRRPVHPDALRLLLLRTLYRGPEHRTDLRVTVGATVAICTLFRRRSAVLAEISGSGCRLLCNAEPKLNSRITLLLPPTLGGGRSFRLNGRVVRIKSRVSNLLGAQLELGVRFERLNGRVQQKLQNLIQERARGPALFDGPTRSVESAAPNEEQGDSESGRERDRRANERRTYARRVIALGEEAAQVVVGRDLSAGGMRIEWRDDMNLGDTVELAVYGEAGSVPLILKAEVVRVEPETGVGLRFEKITPEVEQRLGEIVSELPVQSLDQAEDQGSVVTRILS